jgi:S-formylglutathione hydrolase FrmB
VIPWIDRTYRTRSAENDRWITGFSMGGYGAVSLGLKYPEIFAAVGGFGPCITPSKWGRYWRLDRAMGPARQRRDLLSDSDMNRLKKRDAPVLSLICGEKDFFYRENLAAHRKLREQSIIHQWLDIEAGHSGIEYVGFLGAQLEYFAGKNKQAKPGPDQSNVSRPR